MGVSYERGTPVHSPRRQSATAYPRETLRGGIPGAVLEPSCGHLSPKVNASSYNLTFAIPPRRALRGCAGKPPNHACQQIRGLHAGDGVLAPLSLTQTQTQTQTQTRTHTVSLCLPLFLIGRLFDEGTPYALSGVEQIRGLHAGDGVRAPLRDRRHSRGRPFLLHGDRLSSHTASAPRGEI